MSRRHQGVTPDGRSAPAGPSPVTKWVVSLIILVHFFAILTTVTSATSGTFPRPEIAAELNKPFGPYLRSVFLTNAYRFYAPDPGGIPIMWFRLEYEDESVRWVEVPRRDEFWNRMPYQRHLSVTMLPETTTFPVSPVSFAPNKAGQIILSSYARHLARDYATKENGTSVNLKYVDIYMVTHLLITPELVRQGWQPTDFRFYAPKYAGQYTPKGERVDYFQADYVWDRLPLINAATIYYIAAVILNHDIYPKLQENPSADKDKLLDELGVPAAIRDLLHRMPQLLQRDHIVAKYPSFGMPIDNPKDETLERVSEYIQKEADKLTSGRSGS